MANVLWATGLVVKVLVWASIIIGLLTLMSYAVQEVIDFWKEILGKM